ncbi:hypothetical protein LA080_013949 [Diaporthe eres]|nr:hypothetical protein LA080_013949 [Diaporthe eres]
MGHTIRLLSNLADNTSWPEMQNLDTADGGRWGYDRRPSHTKIRDQDQDDLKEWENLEATREYAAGFIERTTNSYLQAAAAEGAKFSNIQARASKKITFLATLFVPASLCAAVLALPGYSGAQGTTRFWLFWVVSVPIALILAITLLFKNIRTYINEHWKKDDSKREELLKQPPGMRKRFLSGLRGVTGRRDEEKII